MSKLILTTCELCKRSGVKLTEHHLTPKELGGRQLGITLICSTCHKQIHALFTNKELGLKLNTLDKLLNDEKVQRYLRWVEKQPATVEFTIKKSRHVRKKHRK